MLEVYNYLIPSYIRPNKSNNYANSIKDLKNIYNTMRSLNMNSPLYKLNLSDEKQSFALNIKEAALTLKYTTDALSKNGYGVFDSSKMVSSNPEALSIRELSKSVPFDNALNIKIHKLVTPQTNQSIQVNTNRISELSGSYAFKVDTDTNLYTFKLDIAPRSSNLEVLTSMADFINKTGIGLEAFTQSDSLNETTKLLIKSKLRADGQPIIKNFTISDVDKENKPSNNGIISHYGIDNIALEAAGSVYEINGELHSSDSNVFMIAPSLEAAIHEIPSDDVIIQKMPDKDRVFSGINDILDNYNSLMRLALSNSSDNAAHKLSKSLNNIVKSNKKQLAECGIIKEPDGYLKLSEDKAYKALSTGRLRKLFSEDSAFCSSLISAASSISINPMDFVDKKIVTYPDTLHTRNGSPYISSIYSGMLFNYYC